MTLTTHAYLTGPIEGWAAFNLALHAVCDAAGCPDAAARAVTQVSEAWRPGATQIESVPGQGLPAWTDTTFRTDGGDLRAMDEFDGSELVAPACTVEVSWDTSYGGRSPSGLGCSALHAATLALLNARLPEGVTMRWWNEYEGTFHEGAVPADLDTLHQGGREAEDWYGAVVLPAIASHLAAERERS